MKIAFVCSGNTCRSPLALAAWRALQKQGIAPENVQAFSVGLYADGGAPAARHSIELAREWGDDLSRHASQQLSDDQVKPTAAFFVMTPDQVYALREYYDVPSEKIHLLGAFDDTKHPEILDPFGGSREGYETCAARIYRAVEGVAHAIQLGELREQN